MSHRPVICTALMRLVETGLTHGADVNFVNKDGKTALSVAKTKEVIQLLKAAGAK